MTIKLPAAVTAYLAADNAQDLDKLCQCFTNDAQVHDESRQYQGRDSIRSWKEQTAAKYQYTLEPIDAAVTERNVKLRARLTGNFPGSPADVDFAFRRRANVQSSCAQAPYFGIEYGVLNCPDDTPTL